MSNVRDFDPLASPGGGPRSQYLEQQGFSSGLIRAVATTAFPLRIWILDNSEAMTVNDSHRICGTFDNLQNVSVTRWEELQDCVAYHSQMAALFMFPTRFAVSSDVRFDRLDSFLVC